MFCDFRRAREGKQLMAPLPIEQVPSGGRPFKVTGVDFWGPEFVFVNFGQSRSRKKVKRYGCLFTCLLRGLSIWKFVILQQPIRFCVRLIDFWPVEVFQQKNFGASRVPILWEPKTKLRILFKR